VWLKKIDINSTNRNREEIEAKCNDLKFLNWQFIPKTVE
jgi:hypothetical protein